MQPLTQFVFGDRLYIIFNRSGEIYDFAEAAQECVIEVSMEVGGQHDDAFILFDSLKQIVDLDVGITVMSVFYFSALAKQSLRFIKKQKRLARLRLAENRA